MVCKLLYLIIALHARFKHIGQFIYQKAIPERFNVSYDDLGIDTYIFSGDDGLLLLSFICILVSCCWLY